MSTAITVKYIHPNPHNPRKEAGNVTELARSLEVEGLKEPILVRPAELGELDLRLGAMQQYVIEDGFRRWTAYRLKYGQEAKIECHLVRPPKGFNPVQRALVTGLITDVHKKGLSPVERAQAYGRMRDELDMTVAQIAKAVGLTTSSVYDSMTLLDLTPDSQKLVISGRVSVKDAQQAVRDSRAKDRTKKGQRPVSVGWDPDHLGDKHSLAKFARTMCETRGHKSRRKVGGVACGDCWEMVIRQDQTKVVKAQLIQEGVIVPEAIFLTPTQGNGKPGEFHGEPDVLRGSAARANGVR